MPNTISIGSRKIGTGEPCFIIAEAGVNHNGDIDMARQLIDVAVDAGCDAVKFQTFQAEKVCIANAPKAEYQQGTTGEAKSQLDMIRKLELSFEDFRELYGYCSQKSILFLSTPFDSESADFLDSLGMMAFKVPSGELTNHPFLEHIAQKRKPLIVSTGMATLEEVSQAMRVLWDVGAKDMVLLQCVSNYPAKPASMNLRAMRTLEETFGVACGLSDHTIGVDVSLGAAALGACVIEKHFTLNRDLEGPDHQASLDPAGLHALVQGIRNVEAALGDGIKRPVEEELNTAEVARRSIVAARFISAGTAITVEMLDILRPGTGLPPSMRAQIVGQRAQHDIEAGMLLRLDMLA